MRSQIVTPSLLPITDISFLRRGECDALKITPAIIACVTEELSRRLTSSMTQGTAVELTVAGNWMTPILIIPALVPFLDLQKIREAGDKAQGRDDLQEAGRLW